MTLNWNGAVAGFAGLYGASVRNWNVPELNVVRGGISLKLTPPPILKLCSPPQQARREVAERLVEDVGPDHRVQPFAAAARDVARVRVSLSDRERIAAVEADLLDVVIEERLRARAELLADAPDADHVRRAVCSRSLV